MLCAPFDRFTKSKLETASDPPFLYICLITTFSLESACIFDVHFTGPLRIVIMGSLVSLDTAGAILIEFQVCP